MDHETATVVLGNTRSIAVLHRSIHAILLWIYVATIAAMASGVHAQQPAAPPPVQAPPPPQLPPAPAPTPPYVNVTQVLAQAGDYSVFVGMMMETKSDEVFQRNANATQTGIAIFAPTDEAFQDKSTSRLLRGLTVQQKTSLVEYHALNSWVSLGDLQLANQNQTTTVATYNNGGGRYQLNLTANHGNVQIISGWTTANLTSTLYSQKPVSIFGINEVLLPDDIFGLPSPAPAPSPLSGAPVPSPSVALPPSASGPTSIGNTNSSPFSAIPSLSPLMIFLVIFKMIAHMHL
ncbi:hypothetical protein KP509_39G038300 [Ceratopteris richardii]|uniref:FAS1 domain-containing protein n=1 Tax=Ceratopteris richardii TaxID=49495 RepID=A0A8T2Q162_CERRI|nr:hypothetical protein KP509_39G038300 [Ceratopteris richardii]